MYKTGDTELTQLDKTLFEKGYTPNWSKEVFVIKQLIPIQPATYSIQSTKTLEIASRTFYEKELQKVIQSEFPFDVFEVVEENGPHLRVLKIKWEK